MSRPAPAGHGYPSDWERTALTRDGVSFRVRPIRARDEALERQFMLGLSSESRYKRLMYSLKEPPPELLRRFVNVDYQHDMAFVALIGATDDEQFIGVARYGWDAGRSSHEFAVAVADAWQGRGVGATLMRMLLEYAHAQGIRRIHGNILTGNSQMIELAQWLGMRTRDSLEDKGLTEASVTP